MNNCFVLYPKPPCLWGARIYTKGYKTLNVITVAGGVLCTVSSISVRFIYKRTQHYILHDSVLNTERSDNLASQYRKCLFRLMCFSEFLINKKLKFFILFYKININRHS